MISNEKIEAIAYLDLDPIKAKLMHVESGEGWSAEKTNAVESEYRRFLCLMKLYPDEQTAPLVDVDTFWHYHILDTMKYAADCEQAFGYFLHHYPYLGMAGEGDDTQRQAGGERMRELYEKTFGESYLQAAATVQRAAAFCAAANDDAFCAATAKPAFCAATTAKPAFCAATAAFCAATASPAFCAATTASAFCAASAGTAFCAASAGTASRAAANQPAFCAATAKPAFCAATAKPAFCAATAHSAFCAAKTAFCATAAGTGTDPGQGCAPQALVGT